jgi:hypothetical protein
MRLCINLIILSIMMTNTYYSEYMSTTISATQVKYLLFRQSLIFNKIINWNC